MARCIKDRQKAKCQVPGLLIFAGNQKVESSAIQLKHYDSETLAEEEIDSMENVFRKITAKG